jgi:fatty-acyl-CoA synthase
MLGLMQDWPLLCHRVIDHAAINHGGRAVVSRSVEGPIHSTNYAEVRARALKLAQRLEREGIRLGDRVATLAWNTWRHLEAWYGITGTGAIYHTVNPRLFPEQIAWIVNHAEDRLMLTDLTFLPLLEKLADKLPTVERYVVLTDAAHMPATALKNAIPYEQWIGEVDGDFAWRTFDENTAAGMCYTSGTTGNPKGVVYSHRSNVLHSMIASAPDAMGVSCRDVVLPVVPMFHANCWGLALTSPMQGATMVMPGAKLDGASIYELLNDYRVSFTAAVPTVWLMLLQHLEANEAKLPHLKKVVIGGSACPRAITKKFQDIYGVEVCHAWGMTEMSPLGTLGSLKPEYAKLSGDERLDVQDKQGHSPFGVEMIITDDAGKRLPWDDKTFGHLKVRGAAIAKAYYKEPGQIVDRDGFFDTGDVSTIDPHGYMHITDRAKDVIKSGGEWISSIDLENLAVGHPKVAEAAVIGVRHPKWDERPLLVIVLKKDQSANKDEILTFMRGKIANWWMPDDVVFVDEIPHTATGKIQKIVLREQFKDFVLPTAAVAT